MHGLNCLIFAILAKFSFSHVTFPNVLETDIKNLRSKREAPGSAPRNVRARPHSLQTIRIDWDEPEISNGVIQGYKVFYTTNPDLPIVLWMNQEVAGENKMTTVSGLIPNSTYTICLLAFSSIGQGPLSVPVKVMTRKEDIDGSFKGNNTENGINLCTESKYKKYKKMAVAVCNDNLPRHVVQIKFDYFDVENSDYCIFDSVNLLLSTEDREETSFLNGQSCGKNKHRQTFITRGNSLRLELKTDESLALKNFQAKITFVPDTECICKDKMECIQDNTEKCIRGTYCDINICQNGGTCIKNRSTEKCYCPKDFKGDDCSQRDGEFLVRFISAPVDRTIKRGESHVEECKVEVPYGEQVEYNWSIKGRLIEPYNDKTGFGTHPGGVLQIDEFSDALVGQYSCFATSSGGSAEHTFEYRIAEDCNVKIFPGPQAENKKINEMALLICHVDHRAKAVRWKKDGVYIDYDKDDRIKKMANNYLRILNVGMKDAGVYQCEAEDENGCYSYKEGKLQVVDVKSFRSYCGISIHEEAIISSRISKGSEVHHGIYPWHVTFRTTGEAIYRKQAYCGGTLISQRYVITAASCIIDFNAAFRVPFSAENVEILMGTTDCTGTQNDGIRRTVQSFTIHPDYEDRGVYDNDIALIELDSPVEYNDNIRPICVEPAEYNDRVFLGGSFGRVFGKVAGCGAITSRGRLMPKRLRDVYIPYVDRETCLKSMGDKRNRLTDTMFWAGVGFCSLKVALPC
ncbi:uncharacterized protein LOC132723131 isoform X2 [Ruditapes philippinarum]|uniref:uncharacterized protein LOC132723131 isoform X2 n=1 Tax=Ruditapes philippinarum TaxID=129788 RepID=UPI00295B04FA|nr:uncharacterized protein LOC132723131 isoform X2 [Ruditapes philippinarum]